MAETKKPDKLSRAVTMALAAGMSYGKWMALQGSQPKQPKEAPAWVGTRRVCKFCGGEFVQHDKRYRIYCCEAHRQAAYDRKKYEAKRREEDELEI